MATDGRHVTTPWGSTARIRAGYPEGRPSPDFTIWAMGVRERMRPYLVARPHGTGDYLLMGFHDGVEVDQGKWKIAGPVFIVYGPHTPQYYGRTDRPWVHSWMHCHGRFVENKLATSGVELGVPIIGAPIGVLDRFLSDTFHELSEEQHPDHVIVENMFENLVRYMARALEGTEATRRIPERLRAVRAHIELSHESHLTLAMLARRAGLSIPHFCAEFKRYYGISVMSLVIRTRLQHARMLLCDPDMRVSDVASAVGYDDSRHFARLFRKHYGKSPRELRADLLRDG